jgi:hypothetical protein
VYEQGGGITIAGISNCPEVLAAQRIWETTNE